MFTQKDKMISKMITINMALLRSCMLMLALALLAACNTERDVTTLKLAHGLDQTHPVHKAMAFMADRLTALSGGTMRIDIYPSGQLGGERELVELLQIGSLAMTKASSSPMESFIPDFKIFSIPYIFRDENHLWQVLDGSIGERLLNAGKSVHLKGLAFYDSGSRNFYTTDSPVHVPRELHGLKIRVQASQTSIDMVQALGGSATPIPWGELYTALQQGVVDGAENNLPSYFLSNHYQVAPYLSMTKHAYVPDVLLVSLSVWERLSEQQQQWLQQAASESAEYEQTLWEKEAARSLAELKAAGVTVVHPDLAPFEAAVQDLYARYRATPIGPLIEEIRNTR